MQEQQALTITMYARPGCEDSDMVRDWLSEQAIPFSEVDIDQDAEANQFVRRVNNGFRSTPTLVFGEEQFLLVEPEADDLRAAVERAGYTVGA